MPNRQNRFHFFVAALLTGMLSLSLLMSNATPVDAAPVTKSKDEILQAKVERFIGQLNANRRQERRDAELGLIQAGANVLPLLPPPELLPNASIREAVRRVRIYLEQQQAKQETQGSRITIQGEFTLQKLLQQIILQTNNHFDVSLLQKAEIDLQQKLECNYQKILFWEVMDDLSRKYHFQFETTSNTRKIKLVAETADNKSKALSISYSGPCRLAVESAQLRDLIGNPRQNLLRLSIHLLVEPRLRPLFLRIASQKLIAIDADGKILTPFNPDARLELPLGEGGHNLNFKVDYIVAANLKPEQVALSGEINLLMAAGQAKITFNRLNNARGFARRRGGVTALLKKVLFERADDNLHSAHLLVAIAYDTGGRAFESHRTWVFHNEAYLLSKAGKRIDRNSKFGTALQKDGAVVVEYHFDKLAEPVADYRFVYVAPTLIIDLPVKLDAKQIQVTQ